jgi:hypothetical protein
VKPSLVALLLLALATAPARAASWSTPRAYDRATCDPPEACVLEPAPRVAVNARGQAVAAWIDTRGRVRAAVAARPGRFGAASTLARRGLRPSPTIAADGTVTVVWEQGEALRFARGKAGRFGRSQRLAAGSRREDGAARAAAQPDGSVVVAYESGDELRAVMLSRAGRTGAPVTLGEGGFGHDSVRVAADGTVAACCVADGTQAKVAVYRGEWSLASVPPLGDDGRVETVFADATQLLLGVLDVRTEGDAGVSGIPGTARAGADHVVGEPQWASVSKPTRGLAPTVTVDGVGRVVLVYQEKTGPRAFSRVAPVYPGVAGRVARRLTSKQAYQPTVRPLGPGAIAVWQEPGAKWGVAIERRGRFASAPGPGGPGPELHLGEDFHQAYDLATNGSFAVLTWISADGAVRVSQRSGQG